MKLLLTSAGLAGEIKDHLIRLVGKEPEQTLVGYIPVAVEVESDKSYAAVDRQELVDIGFKVIDVDIKNPSEHQVLDDCDIIYVEGGNTFYLLDHVRKSGFDSKLSELIGQGKIYVGVSAGSILAGSSIEVSKYGDCDRYGITEFTGLNLVPFSITPHYNQDLESGTAEQINEFAQAGDPLVGITDSQAVLVVDDQISIIGPGQQYLWNTNPNLLSIE
ncbi:MAG: Type 1 glutamine amidotransferase-like domain-containing protein [Candidatus Uhrbacteria bacterium]